jgi:hypothetical protein
MFTWLVSAVAGLARHPPLSPSSPLITADTSSPRVQFPLPRSLNFGYVTSLAYGCGSACLVHSLVNVTCVRALYLRASSKLELRSLDNLSTITSLQLHSSTRTELVRNRLPAPRVVFFIRILIQGFWYILKHLEIISDKTGDL